MTVTIPDELREVIAAVARRNRISEEEVVRQALVWFAKEDEELWGDFQAWEKVSSEALARVERPLTKELRDELAAWQAMRDHALRLVLGDEEEQW